MLAIAALPLTGQTVLFDFEDSAQGWMLGDGADGITTEIGWAQNYGASVGESSLQTRTTTAGLPDPFAWAFRVDLTADAPETVAIAEAGAEGGMAINFDVTHLEETTPDYDGVFQLFAVLQTNADEISWNQTDNLLGPEGMTVDADWVRTVSIPIPDRDFSEGVNIHIGVKPELDVPSDTYLYLDNFVIGEPVGEGPAGEQYLGTWEIAENWANTGGWLGSLYVEYQPWVWSHNLQSYIYIVEETFSDAGAWSYVPRPAPGE